MSDINLIRALTGNNRIERIRQARLDSSFNTVIAILKEYCSAIPAFSADTIGQELFDEVNNIVIIANLQPDQKRSKAKKEADFKRGMFCECMVRDVLRLALAEIGWKCEWPNDSGPRDLILTSPAKIRFLVDVKTKAVLPGKSGTVTCSESEARALVNGMYKNEKIDEILLAIFNISTAGIYTFADVRRAKTEAWSLSEDGCSWYFEF